MAIGSLGITPGMDINSMVNKIVDAERIPKQQRIDNQRGKINTTISAYGHLRDSLDAMKTQMHEFRQEKGFASRKVDSSNADQVVATATTDAIVGRYSLHVDQLAQNHKVASNVIPEKTDFDAGTLVVSLGDKKASFEIKQDSSLLDVVKSINHDKKNPGVRAAIINDVQGARLVVSSNHSGKEQSIRISTNAESTNSLHKLTYSTAKERREALQEARVQAQQLLFPSEKSTDITAKGVDSADQAKNIESNLLPVSEALQGLHKLINNYQLRVQSYENQYNVDEKTALQKIDQLLTPEQKAQSSQLKKVYHQLKLAKQDQMHYQGMAEVQAAQDAEVTLDGIAKLASHNNIIQNAIDGVDLVLKGVSKPGQNTDVSVEYDRQKVRDGIEKFVNSFNQFYAISNQLSAVDPVSGEKGPLAGDSVVRSANAQLKNVLMTEIKDAPETMNTLTKFGVTTTRQGNLEINDRVLNSQLNNHFDQLSAFFGGTHGFARKIEDSIQSMTGVTGSVRSRERTLSDQNHRLNDDQRSLDRRIESLEERTHNRFSAMKDATGKMRSQLSGMQNALG